MFVILDLFWALRSLLFCICLMLSSSVYDGFTETSVWFLVKIMLWTIKNYIGSTLWPLKLITDQRFTKFKSVYRNKVPIGCRRKLFATNGRVKTSQQQMQYQVRCEFELARYTIQDDKFEYLSDKSMQFLLLRRKLAT